MLPLEARRWIACPHGRHRLWADGLPPGFACCAYCNPRRWTDTASTEMLWETHLHFFSLIYLEIVYAWFAYIHCMHISNAYLMHLSFAYLMHLSFSLYLGRGMQICRGWLQDFDVTWIQWDSILPNCVAWERAVKLKFWHILGLCSLIDCFR